VMSDELMADSRLDLRRSIAWFLLAYGDTVNNMTLKMAGGYSTCEIERRMLDCGVIWGGWV
jgi:hypothetical protein